MDLRDPSTAPTAPLGMTAFKHMEPALANKIILIKNVYFYLVSFVALMMIAISSGNLISAALRAYVFTKADLYSSYYPAAECDPMVKAPEIKKLSATECATQQEQAKKRDEENRIANLQRSATTSISFIVIGLPLFILHWRVARRKVE